MNELSNINKLSKLSESSEYEYEYGQVREGSHACTTPRTTTAAPDTRTRSVRDTTHPYAAYMQHMRSTAGSRKLLWLNTIQYGLVPCKVYLYILVHLLMIDIHTHPVPQQKRMGKYLL